MIALLVVAPALASATSELEYIQAGKGASAHALDARLPKVTLGRWLSGLAAPGTKVAWEANDCGERTGTPADSAVDLPVCAAVQFSLRDGRGVYLVMIVGTDRQGVLRPAEFFGAEINESDTTIAFDTFRDFVTYMKRR